MRGGSGNGGFPGVLSIRKVGGDGEAFHAGWEAGCGFSFPLFDALSDRRG
jgi:hypothetical protein